MLRTLTQPKFRTWFPIFIIWLFHLSAIIGITLGHKDWFLQKTPVNLLISLAAFLWAFPVDTIKKVLTFLLFFGMGMFAEWLGVKHGLLFGEYSYGSNLGSKLDGVPWLIGCFWALLAFVASATLQPLKIPNWTKLVLATGLMVILDYFMEQNAPNFDFWQFRGHVPVKNYITWFILGYLMQVFLWRFKIMGNRTISIHLYAAQLLFFTYFFWIRV